MTPMPEARTIEAALGLTAHRLALELLAPTDEAPDWNAIEWRTAMAVSAMQGISVLLAQRLRWTGPALWQDFLAQQAQQGRRRQERIAELLLRVDDAARRAGVPIVGMKGSALRRLGLYAAGERPMADLDLLVRDADVDGARALIERLGYDAGHATRRHIAFKPSGSRSAVHLGEHADNPVRIELHTRVGERLLFEPVDITRRLWPSDPAPGLQAYPSTAVLMTHLLLHTAGNIASHTLRMIQLVDIARLSADWQAGQWAEVLADHGDGLPWWAVPPLRLASRHQRLTLPAALLEPLERAGPRGLARAMRKATIADVSYIRARVSAFPGIEWSQSPWQSLRLVQDRVLVQTRRRPQPRASDHPAAHATRWSSMSRTRRALHWLVARPLRPHVMHAMQLALDYEAR